MNLASSFINIFLSFLSMQTMYFEEIIFSFKKQYLQKMYIYFQTKSSKKKKFCNYKVKKLKFLTTIIFMLEFGL